MEMNTFDLSPLFRSTIGFERLNQLIDTALSTRDDTSYPPYNIEVTGDDSYRITMAVAGFSQDELTVTQQENALIVRGQRRNEPDTTRMLYRGIAGRVFERRFQLADFVRVTGAHMDNGLLLIELMRELPEEMRPRTIPIDTKPTQQIEDRRAA
jgi:molecular chaperone IbpA